MKLGCRVGLFETGVTKYIRVGTLQQLLHHLHRGGTRLCEQRPPPATHALSQLVWTCRCVWKYLHQQGQIFHFTDGEDNKQKRFSKAILKGKSNFLPSSYLICSASTTNILQEIAPQTPVMSTNACWGGS